MRAATLTIACLVVLASSSGVCQNLLNAPETVVYDSIGDRYFVSSMHAPYYIVEIDQYGSYRIFESDLGSNHGLLIDNNTLWVATQLSSVPALVGIDLITGEPVFEKQKAEWVMTNGLAADTSGYLYMTSGANMLWRIDPVTGNDSLLTNSISYPNGLLFDEVTNRILAVSEFPESYWVYCMDAATYAFSFLSVYPGNYSCLAVDQLGDIYISDFNHDVVLRFDSTLGNNFEVVATGNGPEGICLNQKYSTLVVPNLVDDTLSFFPLDIDVWMSADTTWGESPLTTSFTGSGYMEISEWHWDFGDGTQSDEAAPVHTFSVPGLYDITVRAVTTAGDTLRRVYPNHISNLGDTVWSDTAWIDTYHSNEVVVYAFNTAPLDGLVVPITYSGDMEMVLDSVRTTGCRTEGFKVNDTVFIDQDQKVIVLLLKPKSFGSPLYLSPGSGPIMKLYFTPANPTGGPTLLDLTGDGTAYEPRFYTKAFDYPVHALDGVMVRASCCGLYTVGRTGNCDCSADGKRNLADITRLIDHVYLSKLDLCCREDGNIDGDIQEKINLADITRLIDHVYLSKMETAVCQ